jgi:hypothetical protein
LFQLCGKSMVKKYFVLQAWQNLPSKIKENILCLLPIRINATTLLLPTLDMGCRLFWALMIQRH